MRTLRFKQVDVFTHEPFCGNPVAVVLGAEALDAERMQRIAAWTNLSETTFVLPPSSNVADYRLRIFSPKQELPFAGHPTIGSAHAVAESGFVSPRDGNLRQECLAGILDLAVEETEDGKRIRAQAPKAKISDITDQVIRSLSEALGGDPICDSPILRVDVGVVWIVARMSDAAAVAALKPNMDAVVKISGMTQATGLTVFGAAGAGAAVHVRSFAPLQGVPEDPVCGSGNASVAAFIKHLDLLGEFGVQYIAQQGMQVDRRGEVAVWVNGDSIWIGGYSVTCVDGVLRVE